MIDYTTKDIARFWAKVAITANRDLCWNWVAGKEYGGYGMFGIRDIVYRAHRISWILAYGEIPDGLWVLHKCDNPSCVNPNHLFLGTAQDNVDDMLAKGRHPRGSGEKSTYHKLSQEKADLIRERYATGDISMRKLGDEFSVCAQTIQYIVSNKKWRH